MGSLMSMSQHGSMDSGMLGQNNPSIVQTLNDQELLTVLRRFKDKPHKIPYDVGEEDSVVPNSAVATTSASEPAAANGKSNGSDNGNAKGEKEEKEGKGEEEMEKEKKDKDAMTSLGGHASDSGKYHYDELCDLLSHIFYMRDLRGKRSTFVEIKSMPQLVEFCRPQPTQWRRILRNDPHSFKGFMTLKHVVQVFRSNGANISEAFTRDLIDNYGASPTQTTLYHRAFGIESERNPAHTTKKTKDSKPKKKRGGILGGYVLTLIILGNAMVYILSSSIVSYNIQ